MSRPSSLSCVIGFSYPPRSRANRGIVAFRGQGRAELRRSWRGLRRSRPCGSYQRSRDGPATRRLRRPALAASTASRVRQRSLERTVPPAARRGRRSGQGHRPGARSTAHRVRASSEARVEPTPFGRRAGRCARRSGGEALTAGNEARGRARPRAATCPLASRSCLSRATAGRSTLRSPFRVRGERGSRLVCRGVAPQPRLVACRR